MNEAYQDYMDDAENFGSGEPGDLIRVAVESDYFATDFVISPREAYHMFKALAELQRSTQ